MANISNTSAMKALNEKTYINKLYDNNNKVQTELLEQNYKDNSGVLDTEGQNVEVQAQDAVNRTNVEADKMANQYQGPKLSLGTSQQESLLRTNAQRQNVTTLEQQRNDAMMEIERQRQLLSSQYAAAIKQAQADNDMQRAQQLYNAAQAEEEQLLNLQMQAATLMSSVGDNSILESLLSGKTPKANFTGKTWSQVLKHENELNSIYDKKLEAERLALLMEHEEDMSDLNANRQKQQAMSDEELTKAYVDALQKAKNYAEVQTAYGQGSGAANAARIARDVELQRVLTGLREGQMEKDLSLGMEGFDIGKAYRQAVADKTASVNKERAEKLFEAADKEEQKLVNLQSQLGQILASQGDYSMLGLLYGLSADQINLLMGNVGGGGYDEGGGSGRNPTLMERANVASAAGKNMTEWLTNEAASGGNAGKLAGGNLLDYLAIYT